MKPIFSAGVISTWVVLSISTCCRAASTTFASGTATATGKSQLNLEDQRAECFLDCYQDYGNFANCEFGKSKLLECWCSEPDWVEREEDCVWDVCGVDAYNQYAPIYKRRCQTVQVPSGRPPTWTYTTQWESTTTSVPTTTSIDGVSSTQTTEALTGTNTQAETSSTSAPTASATRQDAATASDNSSSHKRILWTSGGITGIVMVFFVI